jgi:hypothetical protein
MNVIAIKQSKQLTNGVNSVSEVLNSGWTAAVKAEQIVDVKMYHA